VPVVCVVDLAHFSPMPCKYVMETGAMIQLLISLAAQ
jgi:hypothetical protein